MTKRRDKGIGGLLQRHDHKTCPALVVVGHDDQGKPIKKRPEHRCLGRWCGTIDVEIGGRTKRVYVYGHTKTEAGDKLKAALRKKEDGTFSFDGGMSVAAWMKTWLESRKKPPKQLKPQAWSGYASKNKTWITPHLGHHRLSALRGHHIEALYAAMRESGSAESNVAKTHAVLSGALKAAFKKGLIPANPMDRVDAPGSKTARREQFTIAQAFFALAAAGDSARWWLALFYGMRQGEVLGMRWEDVDWRAKTLTIDVTMQEDYDRQGEIEGAPKTEAGKRSLPMVGQIEARMRLHWEEAGRPRTGRVFTPTTKGKDITRNDWQDWRNFLESATRIPFAPPPLISLHGARGTASSLMEAAGLSDRLVAQILGHANVKVTHGYQHADLERVRGELERVELLVLPPSRLGPTTGSGA
jgi:integrase